MVDLRWKPFVWLSGNCLNLTKCFQLTSFLTFLYIVIDILLIPIMFVSLCDCSQPQCYGLRGHWECFCGLTPSGYPKHIRSLDTHPLTGGPTDAGYV